MKEIITLILLLLLCKTSASQISNDEVSIKVSMELSTCISIRETNGCVEIIAAPSLDYYEFFYKECDDIEYKKYNGESVKFNEFLKELCSNNDKCDIKIIIREKIFKD